MKFILMHRTQRSSRWACGSVATATFALVTLAACDGAPANVASGVGSPTVLQASEVHVIGTSESIAVVEDLTVLSDGTVWVLNSVEPFFVGFGPDGDVLQVHGSQGGGPEEFRAPAGFVSGDIDGEAWVFDPIRHALIRISKPGTWSEISLPTDSTPRGTLRGGMGFMNSRVRTARLGDEIILARSFALFIPGQIFSFWLSTWGADLVAVDLATASARGVVSLGEVLGDPAEYLEQTNGFPPFPVWLRLWSVCSDTQIRVHDRLRNQVRNFTRDGTELDPTPLPPPHFTEVTDEQFARAVFALSFAEAAGEVGAQGSPADSARVLNELVQGVEGEPEQLAGFLPRYVDMRCADDGTLWIQPIDIDLGDLRGGHAWLRITQDGVAQEIHFPNRFDVYRFISGRIWGVQRDEFDVASVAWIEVPGSR